ncbi:MAG: hypothetical protein WCO69_03960 [Candidatus Omnitrophota bacterium]
MVISLQKEVYPPEAVLQACYQFLEKAYFFIDLDASGQVIRVHISRKTGPLNKAFKNVFLEELLHSSLRFQLARRNRKLREFIVGSALFSRDAAAGKKHVK